jgi:hypothetical protein
VQRTDSMENLFRNILIKHTSTIPSRADGLPKRRDYIPRPPNAFILFRSSLIRSQQIPVGVEGNHSNRSKIIGTFRNDLVSV